MCPATPRPVTSTATASTSWSSTWPAAGETTRRPASPTRRSSMPTSSTARSSGRSTSARNIREGAHYTQFIVYDLDGDGIAEVVCKTADGTVDGQGTVIGDQKADWVEFGREDSPGPGVPHRLRRSHRRRPGHRRLHPAARRDWRLGRDRRQRRQRPQRQPRGPLPGLRRLPGRPAAQRRHVPRRSTAAASWRPGIFAAAS